MQTSIALGSTICQRDRETESMQYVYAMTYSDAQMGMGIREQFVYSRLQLCIRQVAMYFDCVDAILHCRHFQCKLMAPPINCIEKWEVILGSFLMKDFTPDAIEICRGIRSAKGSY